MAGNSHVTSPDPGPLEVTGGDHEDRHQHLVQVDLEAAVDLKQGAAFTCCFCTNSN